MGDGFVVAQSNDVDIYYYQDEAGTKIKALCMIYVSIFLTRIISWVQHIDGRPLDQTPQIMCEYINIIYNDQ